jgi:hypothetical protein
MEVIETVALGWEIVVEISEGRLRARRDWNTESMRTECPRTLRDLSPYLRDLATS